MSLLHLPHHDGSPVYVSDEAPALGETVTVRVRFPGLRSVTRAKTLPEGIATTRALADISLALARKALDENPREREINLLAISVSKLADEEMVLEDTPLHALDQAADAVRAKFGRQAVGHASVMCRDGDRVPDEFRSLAEADERSR